MYNQLISNDVIFEAKAEAVPYNYRISYKVSIVCIIISKCCGKKGCSPTKLQLVSAAVCTTESRKKLLQMLDYPLSRSSIMVRYDPAISRAINFAISDKLVFRQGNGLFRLSTKGKAFVGLIYVDPLLMKVEKDFFATISSKVTEELIDDLGEQWRRNNA